MEYHQILLSSLNILKILIEYHKIYLYHLKMLIEYHKHFL